MLIKNPFRWYLAKKIGDFPACISTRHTHLRRNTFHLLWKWSLVVYFAFRVKNSLYLLWISQIFCNTFSWFLSLRLCLHLRHRSSNWRTISKRIVIKQDILFWDNTRSFAKSDRKEIQYNIFYNETQNRQIIIIIAKIDWFFGKNWLIYNSVNLYALSIGTFDYNFGNLRKLVLSTHWSYI